MLHLLSSLLTSISCSLVLEMVFQSAFTGKAAVGGFAGATVMVAMRLGIARGVFSNESGLGSAPYRRCCCQD